MAGKSVVFIGNCQAHALFDVYARWLAPSFGGSGAHIPSYTDASDADLTLIASSDIIIYQILSFESRTDLRHIPNAAEVIPFPMLTGWFLWPYTNGHHPMHWAIPEGLKEIFTGEFGDKYLDNQITQGISPEIALENYSSADVVNKANLPRLLELVTGQQRQRDERCGTNFTDWVMSLLKTDRLFISPNHPSLLLFRELAKNVFARLGITTADIAAALDRYCMSPFPRFEPPIHPGVAEYFGTSWYREDYKYLCLFGERMTWRDYYRRYLYHDYGQALQLSLASAHKDAPLEDIISRIRNLEITAARYQSAEGFFALADSYARVGRLDESLQAIERALESDPRWIGYQTRRAEILHALGRNQEAEAEARSVFHYNPEFAQGAIALTEILLRAAKKDEARVIVDAFRQASSQTVTAEELHKKIEAS